MAFSALSPWLQVNAKHWRSDVSVGPRAQNSMRWIRKLAMSAFVTGSKSLKNHSSDTIYWKGDNYNNFICSYTHLPCSNVRLVFFPQAVIQESLSIKTKMILIKCYIYVVLLYRAEAWVKIRKINAAEMWLYRKVSLIENKKEQIYRYQKCNVNFSRK